MVKLFNEDFIIENAKPEDVETLRIIVRDAWLEIYPNKTYGITTEDISAIDWYNSHELDKRRKEIADNSGTVHIWVVKNAKGKIVGFCKVYKYNDYGEIDAMYVLREFQGRGLGKKLIQKAFEWIGSELDIKLKVVVYNSNAVEFYKKFGFRETANKVFYSGTQLPNGKEIPRIEMVKKQT
jgi:ribosomal protein S18 acetylase RimI-like enzyme